MDGELRGQDRKDSLEWLHFAAGLPAKPIQFSGLTTSKQLYTGRCILTGFFARNTATVAGQLVAYDGLDTSGRRLGSATPPASSADDITLGSTGLLCEIGVYMNVVAGSMNGAAWIIPLWRYNVTPPGE